MPTNSDPYSNSRKKLTIIAWAVTVMISTLPEIVFDKLAEDVPYWLIYK